MTDFLLPLHFLKVPLPYFLFLPFYLVYLLNLILPHPHFLTNNHRHSLLDVCGLTGLTCGHAILLCHFRPRFFFFYKNSFRERNERGGKENQTTISHHYHIHTGPLPLLFFFFLPSYPHSISFLIQTAQIGCYHTKEQVIQLRTYQCLPALSTHRAPNWRNQSNLGMNLIEVDFVSILPSELSSRYYRFISYPLIIH